MSKKRISLTLDEDLVERIDSESDLQEVNRSRMVEGIVKEYFRNRSLKTAAVFCGGEELKSMETWDGKPVLAHVIDRLQGSGIQRVILLTGNNREQIKRHFGTEYEGLSLEYVSEEQPEGTASALEKIENKVSSTFLVLNGHVLSDVDLEDMLEVHRDESSVATMALTTVNDPSNYGVAKLKGRTILGFEEKPSSGEEPSRLINAGTYILEPEVFDYLEKGSLGDVFETLSDVRTLSGYIYGGEWRDFSEG